MKAKAIIFDLDGTLLNTLEDLQDALNHALAKNGLPPRSLEEVRSFVGNGLLKLMERGVPTGTDPAVTEQVFADFKPYYQAHSMDKTGPYPGIPALLDKVKAAGYKTAIVTNKAHAAALPLCARFFPQVDLVVGEEAGRPVKPAPDMVWAALEALGVTKEDAVYVGDSQVDVATAANAGLPCICVAWGFRTRAQQQEAGGKVFIDTPEELLEILA